MRKIYIIIFIIYASKTFGQNTLPSTGNVGIGTTTPSNLLEVNSGSTTTNNIGQITTRATFGTNGIAGVNLKIDNTNLWQLQTDNNVGNNFFIQYNANTATRYFSLTPSGNIGIGTTSPQYKLDAVGNSFFLGTHSNSTTPTYLSLTSGLNANSMINFGYYDTFDATIWRVGRIAAEHSFRISNWSSGSESNVFTALLNGNVGIGTTNPLRKFTVSTSTDFDGLEIYNSVQSPTINLKSGSANTAARNWAFSTNHYLFGDFNILSSSTAGGGLTSSWMTITKEGNVGLTNTNPQAKLDVNGTTRLGMGVAESWFPYVDNYAYISGKGIIFRKDAQGGAGEFMRISESGNLGIGTSTPKNKLDLGSGTNNRGISWGGLSNNYSNIWTKWSNGNLVFATGLAPNGQTSNFESSYADNGMGKAAIELGAFENGGDIMFYSNPPSNVTAGTVFTPTERMRIKSNGNVGIGTPNPVYKFQVQSSTNGDIIAEIRNNSTTGYGLRIKNNNDNQYSLAIQNASDNAQNIQLFGSGNSYFAGSMSLGATAPTGYKLAVGGNMIAEKVKVKKRDASGNWPDFVFSPSYKLPNLTEVENFVKQNQHLPEIPSATEIEKEGQDLGEMNRLLLKKVEELTLYLIEQQKEIKALKSKVEKLEKK